MTLLHSAWRKVGQVMSVCLLGAGMAGCVSTGYGPMGVTGGYVDKIVDANTAVIVVSGNGFTSPERVDRCCCCGRPS